MSGKDAVGTGTAGSQYDATQWSFPAVPYDETNFNDCDKCTSDCCCVSDWLEHEEVSYWLEHNNVR